MHCSEKIKNENPLNGNETPKIELLTTNEKVPFDDKNSEQTRGGVGGTEVGWHCIHVRLITQIQPEFL